MQFLLVSMTGPTLVFGVIPIKHPGKEEYVLLCLYAVADLLGLSTGASVEKHVQFLSPMTALALVFGVIPRQHPDIVVVFYAVADLLGISTGAWRLRCEGLAAMGIWEVAQYARGKGLAEEHVQRLALVAWAGDKGCSSTPAAADWKGWRTANADWANSRNMSYGDNWPTGLEAHAAGKWRGTVLEY